MATQITYSWEPDGEERGMAAHPCSQTFINSAVPPNLRKVRVFPRAHCFSGHIPFNLRVVSSYITRTHGHMGLTYRQGNSSKMVQGFPLVGSNLLPCTEQIETHPGAEFSLVHVYTSTQVRDGYKGPQLCPTCPIPSHLILPGMGCMHRRRKIS